MTVLELLEVHCIKDDAVNFIVEKEEFFLPVLALLSNHTAKVVSPAFYDLKQELVERISEISMEENPYGWRTFTSFDGMSNHPWIFYVDSAYFPQMSFHGSVELAGNAKGKWSGVPQQEQSLTILANACKKQGFKGGIVSHHKLMANYMACKGDSIGETQISHKTKRKEILFTFNHKDGLEVQKLKDGELLKVLPAESQQESAAIQSFFSSIALKEEKEEEEEKEEADEEEGEETSDESSSDDSSKVSSEGELKDSPEEAPEGESSKAEDAKETTEEGEVSGDDVPEEAPQGGGPQEEESLSESLFDFEKEEAVREQKIRQEVSRYEPPTELENAEKVTRKTFDEYTYMGEVTTNPKIGSALTKLSSAVDFSQKAHGHDKLDARAFIKALLTSPHNMTSAKHGYDKGEVYLFVDTNCKNCNSERCTWFHYSEFTRTVIESAKAFDNIHVWSGSKCRPEMNEKTQMRHFLKERNFEDNLDAWLNKFKPKKGSTFIFIGEAFNITMDASKVNKALFDYNAVWLDSKKGQSDQRIVKGLISAGIKYKPKCYNAELLLRGLHSV